MTPPAAAEDVISLTGIAVACLIGVYPHERRTLQRLEVDVELHVATRSAARDGALAKTVNYAVASAEIRFLLEACSFRLLETAADALCHYLLAPPPTDRRQAQVEGCRVTLRKPEAVGDGVVAGLTVARRRADVMIGAETNGYGLVDVIHAGRDCGIYRLRIPPHGSIPAHYHKATDEAELALSKGLLLQDRPLAPGVAHFWPRGFVHAYRNPTAVERTVLCVDRPAFTPEDEIVVVGGPVVLAPPPRDVTKVYYRQPQEA